MPHKALMGLRNTLFFICMSCISLESYGFYTVQDTGDLLKEDEFRFAAEVQGVTNGDEGFNILGKFDMGLNEEANLRFVAGTGTTDYLFSALYKWVPIPDFEDQPAIGFSFGPQIANYEDETEIAGRVIPFASKKFEIDVGHISPYVALPLAFATYDDETENPLQLVIGTHLEHTGFEHFSFTAEVGLDLSDAPSYFSVGAIFPTYLWDN